MLSALPFNVSDVLVSTAQLFAQKAPPNWQNPIVQTYAIAPFDMDFDPHTHAGEIPSPCIKQCAVDAQSGWCQGCWRSLDEISCWPLASDEAKRTIWVAIMQRRLPACR